MRSVQLPGGAGAEFEDPVEVDEAGAALNDVIGSLRAQVVEVAREHTDVKTRLAKLEMLVMRAGEDRPPE